MVIWSWAYYLWNLFYLHLIISFFFYYFYTFVIIFWNPETTWYFLLYWLIVEYFLIMDYLIPLLEVLKLFFTHFLISLIYQIKFIFHNFFKNLYFIFSLWLIYDNIHSIQNWFIFVQDLFLNQYVSYSINTFQYPYLTFFLFITWFFIHINFQQYKICRINVLCYKQGVHLLFGDTNGIMRILFDCPFPVVALLFRTGFLASSSLDMWR